MREPIDIYIGWDSREPDVTDICAHSIARHTTYPHTIRYLKHRELRKANYFSRPWMVRSDDGEMVDLIDNKPFSTEFSHTRFLIPALNKYKGLALFLDADMIFTTDISKLINQIDKTKAVSVVKHNHQPNEDKLKMDNRLQIGYPRKNWSSFVMWNCEHPLNRQITQEYVNRHTGGSMHAFSWLPNTDIGDLPKSYNYIAGISPKMPWAIKAPAVPDVIHYTEGGPWFKECCLSNIPYGELWERERDHWMDDGGTCYDKGLKK